MPMVDWAALAPCMCWHQAAVAPPRYCLSAGALALGSLAWGDVAGASAEGALLGEHRRFTWHGGWSHHQQVGIPGDSGPGARYRPSWQAHEDGLLLPPDGTRYRWYAPSAPGNRGVWAGPGMIPSPIFSNVSDRRAVRVAVAHPVEAETLAVPTLLLLLGGYLALIDALGRHSPAMLGEGGGSRAR